MTNSGVGMPCPVCAVPLVMSERQGVEIDYCPQCRGVWLDRGELDKILVRERQMREGADEDFFAEVEGRRSGGSVGAPPRREEYYDDEPRRGRRKRSFLEDLLDFD